MTTEQRKDELRKKFIDTMNLNAEVLIEGTDHVFDFFYSEIEAREKQIDIEERAERIEDSTFEERCSEASHYTWLDDENKRLETKIQRLEEIIKAVDLMVYEIGSNGNMGYYEALEHYNKLKSKLPSGI